MIDRPKVWIATAALAVAALVVLGIGSWQPAPPAIDGYYAGTIALQVLAVAATALAVVSWRRSRRTAGR